MVIANTEFRRIDVHRYTMVEHSSNEISIIDYFLIRKQLKNYKEQLHLIRINCGDRRCENIQENGNL